MQPSFVSLLIFWLLFTLGSLFLSAFNAATLKLGKFQSKKILFQSLFFWKRFILKNGWEKFYNLTSIAKHIYCLLYAILAISFVKVSFLQKPFYLIIFTLLIVIFFLIIDSSTRVIASIWSKIFLRISAPIVSFFLGLVSIFILPFFKLSLFIKNFFAKEKLEINPIRDKKSILEIIKDSELNMLLSSSEQNIIASFITFKEKSAREIMVPRMDIFALNAKTSIKDACAHLLTEKHYVLFDLCTVSFANRIQRCFCSR